MQVHVLEIFEHWFVHENGKQRLMGKKHVTCWAAKEDLFDETMKWIENHSSLDEDLVFLARTVALSEGISDFDKFLHISSLFNRFSKFAAENSKRSIYQQPKKLTWIEITFSETKLRGSVFE